MSMSLENCQTTREVVDWQGGAFTERQLQVIQRLIALYHRERLIDALECWDKP